MRTISSRIDMLRHCADLYDGTTKPELPKEMQRPILAQELREAADTITELRKERDRLLMNANPTANELRRVRAAWEKDRDENDRLKSENEKLRELVRELYEDQCMDSDQWKYRDRMRELGVEVDE